MEAVVGFVAGVGGGLALGMVLGRFGWLREILMPYLVAIYGIPRPALAPLFVLWFGIGVTSKVVLIVSLVYFVLVLYVVAGTRHVNPDLLRLAQTLGASASQIVAKIVIPSLLPWVFAGMKLGLGLAVIGAVVGEIISSEAGLGHYILASAYRADTEGIYVGLLALGMMSWVLVYSTERLDRRLFHWRHDVSF
jgi:NitT/TauT family transport system permease protein